MVRNTHPEWEQKKRTSEERSKNKKINYIRIKYRNRTKRENVKESRITRKKKHETKMCASSNNEGTNENIVLRTRLATKIERNQIMCGTEEDKKGVK